MPEPVDELQLGLGRGVSRGQQEKRATSVPHDLLDAAAAAALVAPAIGR